MKKVAIFTINDNNNYGNRLQNYAAQETLKKMDLDVYTINNATICATKEKISIRNFVPKLVRKIKRTLKKILNLKNKNGIELRGKRFEEFNNNVMYYSISISNNSIPIKFDNEFDYFFTGSDQVWNPNFPRTSYIDFLTFISNEKRNSFSASFGVNHIPEINKENYINYLKGMNNISVREDRGKEIIEELTGRTDVEVLVDPTMLLTAEEWDKVAKKPKQLKCDKYILNYFLGELSESRKNEIDRIAKENNCEVINILDKKSPFYQTGPSEFLYLEKNAFLICTDSFHSSVFAILYNRPFIVFDREDKEVKMNSRIETLINKFNLKNRKFEGKITKENIEHDYTEAYQILEKEREKSKRFLEKCLNNN